MDKKKILICIPSVWGVRNLIHSGLTKQFGEQYVLYYAVPTKGVTLLTSLGISKANIVELPEVTFSGKYKLISLLVSFSFIHKFPIKKNKIFKKVIRANAKNNFDYNTKIRPLKFLARLFTFKPAFNFIRKIETKLYLNEIPVGLKKELATINPDLTISTTFVTGNEFLITRYIQSLGKKTIAHVLSFDNITSRGYYPLEDFQHFMVWNDTMKNELIKYYGVKANNISITGTPQFDFHVRDEFKWDKQKLYSQIGLNINAPYFLYCANHLTLTPNEPELVEQIIDTCFNDDGLKHYQWVIRPHPLDDYKRWNNTVSKYKHVFFSEPWDNSINDESQFACPSIDEITLLSNSLIHSSVVLNIASTISIDAAICNKPVVCLGFHPNKTTIDYTTYEKFHYTHHYQPIIDTGSISLVLTIDELVNELHTIVNTPAYKQTERQALVNEYTVINKGHSAHIIANIIKQQCP